MKITDIEQQVAAEAVSLQLHEDGLHGVLCGTVFDKPFKSQARALRWQQTHRAAAIKIMHRYGLVRDAAGEENGKS